VASKVTRRYLTLSAVGEQIKDERGDLLGETLSYDDQKSKSVTHSAKPLSIGGEKTTSATHSA
jgi:hypothetical protein